MTMGLIATLHYLTTIPLTLHRIFTPQQLGVSLAYYPLVGTLIGVCLLISHTVLRLLFTDAIAAALLLVVWMLLTGGLHLDGFMDACDGLFSHRAAEERLRIMRDVPVGAWGVVGVVLLLLVKSAALSAAPATGALLLAPMLTRWTMSMCIVAFPYGRAEGWGLTLKEQAGRRQVMPATVGMLLILWLMQSVSGLIALAAATITTLLIARFALDRLPGLTGDVYGLIAEACEVIVLLVFAARLA